MERRGDHRRDGLNVCATFQPRVRESARFFYCLRNLNFGGQGRAEAKNRLKLIAILAALPE